MDLPTKLLKTVVFAFPVTPPSCFWTARFLKQNLSVYQLVGMIFRLDQLLVHLNGITSLFVEAILTSTSTGLINQRKTGVSGIQHVMLKICKSEQDNARTVKNMHCWGFTLFILFYSFKRYNAQFVFILIHTLHNVFIGRFSSPPTALGRTSIRPARHDHVWGFFEFSERSL